MARGFDENILVQLEQFILEYQKANRKSPTIKVIIKNFSFFRNSYSKVQRYVHELQEKNRITYTKHLGIDMAPILLSGRTNPTSLVGACPCGTPFFAVENIEGTYDLPVELFGAEEHFMLRAVGSSMIDSGIFNGDVMVVRRQNYAEAGEIVIALIGDEATAKIFLPQKDHIILRAANKSTRNGQPVYPDIITRDCSILGVVDNVIHKPKAK